VNDLEFTWSQPMTELANKLYMMQTEIGRLKHERDEAWFKIGRIYNEIDCRIEHGADSNGHLEAIHKMFKGNL
jgi:hypothetical protein